MKHIGYLTILILIASSLHAQIPGYKGKRVTAGYGFYASPGLIGSRGATPVNMLHEAYIEGTTATRFMVGFSARFYNGIYSNGREVQLFNVFGSHTPTQMSDNPEGSYKISGRNFMLYGKLFSQNYVAPWGRYFLFGVTLNTFETTYEKSNMRILVDNNDYGYQNSTQYYFSNFGSTLQEYKKVDVCIGFGRSRIIGNRVILDYGYNVNLFALAFTLFDAGDQGLPDSDVLSPDIYIAKTSASRVRGINRFNLFLKVGILLF